MNPLIIAAVTSLGLVLIAAVINARKIAKGEVDPALSTWFMSLAAAGMSFATYLIAGQGDLIAGALNGADVLSITLITITIIFFSKRGWRLKSFEKLYLVALVVIALFWLVTSDAFTSNLLIQVLFSVAYIPTFYNIITSGKNTESFTSWGLECAAALVSLYPSLHAFLTNGNILSLVYSMRSVILLGATLILMWIYWKRKDPAINDVSIEYAHIYTNDKIEEEQKFSLEILNKVRNEETGYTKSFVIVVDDYSFPDQAFNYDNFTAWLVEKGFKPDAVFRQSQIVSACDEVLRLMQNATLKTQLTDYIKAKKYPVSLFIAAWYLLRLGCITHPAFDNRLTARRLVNILPASLKDFEDRAIAIIKTTRFAGHIPQITDRYIPGRLVA